MTPMANFFTPSHVLLMMAFLMLILAEGGTSRSTTHPAILNWR